MFRSQFMLEKGERRDQAEKDGDTLRGGAAGPIRGPKGVSDSSFGN